MKSNEAYEAEIERLKAHIEIKNKKIESLYSLIKFSREQGIKEFAKKLKQKSYTECDITGYRYQVVQVEEIDNLVKEMTEKEVQP